jgi:hypothetical protein
MLQKGKQFLLHKWHLSCYSCCKLNDKSWMRKGLNSVVLVDIYTQYEQNIIFGSMLVFHYLNFIKVEPVLSVLLLFQFLITTSNFSNVRINMKIACCRDKTCSFSWYIYTIWTKYYFWLNASFSLFKFYKSWTVHQIRLKPFPP